jgi:DNA-directed RNA polymerase subunit beta'
VVKGMRRIIIETDEGTRHEYSVLRSVHVNVQEGERVRAGDPLHAIARRREKGPIDPHDVLAVLGIKELERYLADKIQEVYGSQSVASTAGRLQ